MGTLSTAQRMPFRIVKKTTLAVPGVAYVLDPDFFITARNAGEEWYFRVVAFISCPHEDDFGFTWANAVNDEDFRNQYFVWDATTLIERGSIKTAAATNVTLAADLTLYEDVVLIEGTVSANAAGAVTLQWKKIADTQEDMAVHEGSFMFAAPLVL